ncbi:hypothetical protein CBS133816_10590 [Aspergillus niger]|nr:hypothetical protein CBS133816_10590 [Aspergillus niger]KAI2963888.1 hypothetical protein CBS147324_8779 [Aspergillus niger]
MAISRYPLRGCGVSIRLSIEGLAQALFERLVFFFCFCPLVPDVCRHPFEGAVYLSRYRVSLREFDGLLDLVPALFEGLVSNPLPCLLESPACFLCALVPALFESSGWLYSLSTGSLSITNYTSQPHMAPNHWLLQTESTASFCLRLSASVNPSVLRRRRRPRVHHLMASKNGRYEKQRECFSFFHGPPLVKPNLSSPLTTSIEYHASLTRTKPGIEIAMRKVQDDRLNWEHDMIAKLGDFLIEEVDQQLQDTRSKGS